MFVPKGAQHDQHPTNQAVAKVQMRIADQHIICLTNSPSH